MEKRKTISFGCLNNFALLGIFDHPLVIRFRYVSSILLIFLSFYLFLPGVHGQGPGLYKDGKKILDLEEIVDSSLAVGKIAPLQRETTGMKFYKQVLGKETPNQFKEQKEYIYTVLKCRDLVQRISTNSEINSLSTSEIDQLLALEENLSSANQALLEEFNKIEMNLKNSGYPPEKIDRHTKMVERHRIIAGRLLDLLGSLRNANISEDQSILKNVLQELHKYFTDNIFQYDTPLLNSQPLPVMMSKEKAPVIQRDALPPVLQAAYPTFTVKLGGPDPDDLDSTIDVQFTDDIIQTAESLHHSATEIYTFVRENFEFEPYLGSRKGSQQTLDHRRGNDYDQASLLIALLRVSGIPARYATGTVEMTLAQATNWLGIDDPVNAGSILTTAGMEGVLVYMGPDPVAIRCRRVWVEAWLPFINYRGTANDSVGFMWVPIDPTFKQYNYRTGINLLAEIGFDAETFVNNYISTLHSETPIEMFREMLIDSLVVHHPGATYDDLLTTRSIIKETDGILPGTLPYELIMKDGVFSEIPVNKRYYIQFNLKYDEYGIDILNYTTSLPEIVGKQVTISYVGATPEDQYIIDTAGGIFNVQLPYMVDLKPVLKIDGCEVARASGSIMMGITHYSDMHFTAPTGAQNQMPTVSNTIIAGNYQGIGLDTEDAFPSFFDVPQTTCPEDYLGQEVHQTALTYLNNVDVAGDEAADWMHQVVMNDVSEAIVENTVRVLFNGWGDPITFEWTGMIVDADRKIIGPFSVDGADNDCDYMRLGGADGSIQENKLFEDRFGEEAISAIKILELASDSAIQVCEITYSIAAECPGISQPSSIISAINFALAQGHHVIIPKRQFTYYNWTGTGWIDIDPVTCAAGYIISGGQGGGATVQEWDITIPDLFCIQPIGPIAVSPSSASGLYCAENTAKWIFTVPTMKYWGKNKDGSCKLLKSGSKRFPVNFTIKYVADHWGVGEYTFRCGSTTADCGCAMIDTHVVIIKTSIDGYVYGESGRKIANMQKLSNPANVAASGYVKFKATIEPAGVDGDLYYKWSASSGGGTLVAPHEGSGVSFREVKWDAPSDHEKNVALTLEVKESASGPIICTQRVRLKTIRPYVVRVMFVSDWGEKQPIADAVEPEYDAIANKYSPVCYVKSSAIKVRVDLAGDKKSDAGNYLTRKTPIKVTATGVYGAINNQFDEATIDISTESWSVLDYAMVAIESDDVLPDKVIEYEDFEMHWTFKVMNSSGNWITVYEEGPDYSQKTVHKESSLFHTYGFYTIYDDYECEADKFTKSHVDDAVSWAPRTVNPSEHDVAHSVMQNVNGMITSGCICPGAFSNAWSEPCWTGARGDHSSGMCCCRAHGMMLVIQVLGVGVYTHVYANERPEPGEKDFNPSTPVYCPGCKKYCYRKYWAGFWNNWEGACRSGAAGSTCYAPAGQIEGSYNEIRNAFGAYYWVWSGDGPFANKCPGGPGHLPPP